MRQDVTLCLLVALAACGGSDPLVPPATGTVRVVAHTDGSFLDADGYTATLDQASSLPLPINGTIHFRDVEPGVHQVHIAGMADNCVLTPADLAVTVTAGETSVVELHLLCRMDLHGRLVFMSEAYGWPQLLAMYPDGTGRIRLFEDHYSNGAPAIVPDGSAIVYGSHRNGAWRLFRFDVATGTAQPLPHIGAMEFQPAVSPDGTQIVFEVMAADDASRIWVMGVNGENPRALTSGPVSELSDVAPSWSPDGGWIIFSRTGTLHWMPADGTTPYPVPGVTGSANHPAWSPDGRYIAYTGLSDDSGDGIPENYDIYVFDLLLNTGRRVTTSPDQEDSPKWSPDGSAIAYHRVVNGHIQLFRVQADGSRAVNLTSQPVHEGQPAWGPAR
jgi:Tol biopolymer transport system component